MKLYALVNVGILAAVGTNFAGDQSEEADSSVDCRDRYHAIMQESGYFDSIDGLEPITVYDIECDNDGRKHQSVRYKFQSPLSWSRFGVRYVISGKVRIVGDSIASDPARWANPVKSIHRAVLRFEADPFCQLYLTMVRPQTLIYDSPNVRTDSSSFYYVEFDANCDEVWSYGWAFEKPQRQLPRVFDELNDLPWLHEFALNVGVSSVTQSALFYWINGNYSDLPYIRYPLRQYRSREETYAADLPPGFEWKEFPVVQRIENELKRLLDQGFEFPLEVTDSVPTVYKISTCKHGHIVDLPFLPVDKNKTLMLKMHLSLSDSLLDYSVSYKDTVTGEMYQSRNLSCFTY